MPSRLFLDRQLTGARRCAENFRTFAGTTDNPVAQRILSDIAEAADAFAARVERQLTTLEAHDKAPRGETEIGNALARRE